MAEYTIRMADERGHMLEQLEHGTSEVEIRDRFAQQGFLVYSVKPKACSRPNFACRSAAKFRRTSLSSSISSL